MRYLLRVSFLFVLASHFCFAWAEDVHPKEKTAPIRLLSVNETIERAKNIPSGEWWGPLSQTFDSSRCPLNPEARVEMYRILDDSEQKFIWGNMVDYLALLGQDEDIDKVENLICRYTNKKLDDSEKLLLYSIICFAASMDRRGMSKGTKLIDDMMHPEYWERFDITLPNGKTSVPTFCEIAITSKSNNVDPNYKEKVQGIFDGIKDAKLKQVYLDILSRGIQNYDKLAEARRTGDWTTYYGKPLPTPSVTQEVERAHSYRAYDELYTSGTLWATPAKISDAAKATLIKESQESFYNTLAALGRRQDFLYLINHTAIDGTPLLLLEEQNSWNVEKIFKNKTDLKERWKRLVPVACLFLDKEPKSSECFVYQRPNFGVSGDSIVPPWRDLHKTPKDCSSLLIIRFRYDDLKDVAKKYPDIFTNKGRIPSVSETGEPYVVMIWEAGLWYWNPFGM